MPITLTRFARRPVTTALGVLAVETALYWLVAGGLFPFDDSYITLTAARNLLERGNIAIDPATAWFGITSPLHVIILTLLGALTGIETAARIVGVAAHVLIVVAAARLAAGIAGPRHAERAAPLAALAAAASGFLTLHSVNGMETTLFVAVVAWAFVAHQRALENGAKRSLVRIVLCATAILIRPEGWLLAAVLQADAARVGWKQRGWRSVASAVGGGLLILALVAPLLMIQAASTMSPFPTSAGAKAAFFRLGTPDAVGRSLLAALQGLIKLFGRHAPWTILALPALRRAKLPVEGDAAPPTALPAMAVFSVALLGSYVVKFPVGLQMYWLRYSMPVLLVMIVAASAGYARWSANAPEPKHRRAAWVLAAFLALDALLGLKNLRSDIAATRRAVIPTALWIRDHAAERDLVAAHDIGALWYFSDRRVMDMVGLTDPVVARANQFDVNKAALRRILRRRRPAYVVMFDSWNRAFFHFDEAIAAGNLTKVWQSEPVAGPATRYVVYRVAPTSGIAPAPLKPQAASPKP